MCVHIFFYNFFATHGTQVVGKLAFSTVALLRFHRVAGKVMVDKSALLRHARKTYDGYAPIEFSYLSFFNERLI